MNNIYSNIKNFKTNLIFKKYFKIIFMWFMIPCIICAVCLYCFFIHNSKKEKKQQLMDFSNSASVKVDNTLENVNEFYNGLISNTDIISYFMQAEYEPDNRPLYNSVSDILQYSTLFDQQIIDVSLYNYNTRYVFSNESGGFIDYLPTKQWYRTLENTNSNVVHESINYNNKNILSFCFNVTLYQKNAGLVVIDIDKNAFMNYCISPSYNSPSVDTLFYIPDSNRIIFHNEEFEINREIIPELIKSQTKGNSNSAYTDSKNKHYFLTSMNNWNLHMITICDYAAYSEVNKIVFPYISLITVLLIILAFVLSFFSSSILYNEIIKFVRHLERIVLGEKFETPYSEFKLVTNNIFMLRNKNLDLENSIAEHIEKLNKLQCLALQLQINPHFLFNTLNLINSYIIINGGGDNETLLISNLSDILYYTLTTTDYFVPLSSEIEYCQKYIEIESIKYKHSFDVMWDIPDELKNEQIIKMSIQPIIENAVKHGIRNLLNKRGIITIRAYKNSNTLITEISNNGAPIPQDKLNELRTLMTSDLLPENNHIGLLNVNQRCKLIYGEDYKIQIDSDDDLTKFTLTFPI